MVADVNTPRTYKNTELNTEKTVKMNAGCSHVVFESSSNQDDDVVKFDLSRYGKKRVYQKPKYAWVYKLEDIGD